MSMVRYRTYVRWQPRPCPLSEMRHSLPLPVGSDEGKREATDEEASDADREASLSLGANLEGNCIRENSYGRGRRGKKAGNGW